MLFTSSQAPECCINVAVGGVQILETIVGIGVINAAVSKAGPIPDEVFKLDIRYNSSQLTAPTSTKCACLGVCNTSVLGGSCHQNMACASQAQ